jgi:hypothetical protein
MLKVTTAISHANLHVQRAQESYVIINHHSYSTFLWQVNLINALKENRWLASCAVPKSYSASLAESQWVALWLLFPEEYSHDSWPAKPQTAVTLRTTCM